MRAFENHTHWSAVKDVCRRLKEAGHQALLAGGCVRDLLMNREPHDFDIATEALPDEVEKLFPRALPVGKAFGVIILPQDGFQLEIATFRQDLEYKDGRRPEGVTFSTPEEDAKRRDFTVNALFLDIDTGQVIDYVDGQKDIASKVIRTNGDPEKRFEEDKLRLLRAVRFSAQLDFEIEPLTLSAVRRLSPEIHVVSRERVRDELLKLLKQPARLCGLKLLVETGLLAALFPEGAARIHVKLPEWYRFFEILNDLDESVLSPALWLALFFYPIAELWHAEGREDRGIERDLREKYLKGLRLDNKMIETILFAYRNVPRYLAPEKIRKGEMALLLLNPNSDAAEALASVLERATYSGPPLSGPTERERAIATLKRVAFGGKPAAAVSPWMTGADAKALGFEPGPRLGEMLREAYMLQLEGVFKNRDEALAWARLQVQR